MKLTSLDRDKGSYVEFILNNHLFAKTPNYLPTFINPTPRMKVQARTRSGSALRAIWHQALGPFASPRLCPSQLENSDQSPVAFVGLAVLCMMSCQCVFSKCYWTNKGIFDLVCPENHYSWQPALRIHEVGLLWVLFIVKWHLLESLSRVGILGWLPVLLVNLCRMQLMTSEPEEG